jgi:DNA replication protein DnaC
MTILMDQLQDLCRSLRLAESAKELPSIIRKAEAHQWTHHELLHELFTYEQKCREEKLINKLLKWARFPYIKTLDEFNLNEQRSVSTKQLKQLRELLWMEQLYNIILLGPPGVGKTHLAIGLGMEAISRGHQVSFLPMGELVHILKTKEFSRKSQTTYKRIKDSDLLIIDDMMYMAMDTKEANLFFHLINELYDKSSIVLTSNKGPDQWGELLGDQGITTAILDRLLHRVEVINIDEDSYRMKNRSTIFGEGA